MIACHWYCYVYLMTGGMLELTAPYGAIALILIGTYLVVKL